jgi:hypothetical protein
LAVSFLLSCPGCCSTWRRLAGGACGRRPSGRTSLPGRGCQRAGHAVRRRSVFTIGCPPIRFRCLGPGVQPSGVQPSGVQPSGVQPSGVRPAGVRASARVPPSRPRQPAVALGITSVRWATFTTGTDRVARGLGCPERLGRPPESAWKGATVRRWWEAGGEAAVADLAGSGPGRGCGRAPPLTGKGEPARRAGRRRLPAAPGMGARVQARSCTWAWLAACLEHDHARWSLWSLLARWTGPGRGQRARWCGWGAAPARPSQEVSEPGSGTTPL